MFVRGMVLFRLGCYCLLCDRNLLQRGDGHGVQQGSCPCSEAADCLAGVSKPWEQKNTARNPSMAHGTAAHTQDTFRRWKEGHHLATQSDKKRRDGGVRVCNMCVFMNT